MDFAVVQEATPRYFSMATRNLEENSAASAEIQHTHSASDEFWESDDFTQELPCRARGASHPRFISMATQNFEETVTQRPNFIKSDSRMFWESDTPVEELLEKQAHKRASLSDQETQPPADSDVLIAEPTEEAVRQDREKLVKNGDDDDDKHATTMDSSEPRGIKGVPIFRNGWGLGGLVTKSNAGVDVDSNPRSIGWGEWQGLPRSNTSISDLSSARKSNSRQSTAEFITVSSKCDLQDTSEICDDDNSYAGNDVASKYATADTGVGRAPMMEDNTLEDAPTEAAEELALADEDNAPAATAMRHALVEEGNTLKDSPAETAMKQPLTEEDNTLEDAPADAAEGRAWVGEDHTLEDAPADAAEGRAPMEKVNPWKDAPVEAAVGHALAKEDDSSEDTSAGTPEVAETPASAACKDQGVSYEAACASFHNDVPCSVQAGSITGLYVRQHFKRAFARLRCHR